MTSQIFHLYSYVCYISDFVCLLRVKEIKVTEQFKDFQMSDFVQIAKLKLIV
jgi:hypothetical protein